MGAPLRLERFDRATEPAPAFGQSDLDAAFARGVAQGRQESEALRADQLCAALDELSGRLGAEQAARAAAGEGQVRALAPLVGALLGAITPLAARTRLEAALLAELRQLAGSVTPLSARVRCGADMAAFAAACLAATGVEAIALDPSGPEGTVEAELLGGTIAWDVAAVADQLRALVHEIMETE